MPTPTFADFRLNYLNRNERNKNPLITEMFRIEDYVIQLQRDLNWLLSNLDTLNINRLDAKVIKTGTLDANLVTVRSDLTGSSFIQMDANGITASDGVINTFEIDSTGKAYFRGDITSEATITGALIQTALTGRRIVLNGSYLASYNTDTLDGFTLDGSDGFLRWYNSGTNTGLIGRDTSQWYEQFLFSHDYLLFNGLESISLSTPIVNIGNIGSDIYMYGGVYLENVGSITSTTPTGYSEGALVYGTSRHGTAPHYFKNGNWVALSGLVV